MADTHIAPETQHVARVEHVTHQAVVLAQVQAFAFAGHDTGRILSTMLQNSQSIVDGLVNGTAGYDSYYAAHRFLFTSLTLTDQA